MRTDYLVLVIVFCSLALGFVVAFGAALISGARSLKDRATKTFWRIAAVFGLIGIALCAWIVNIRPTVEMWPFVLFVFGIPFLFFYGQVIALGLFVMREATTRTRIWFATLPVLALGACYSAYRMSSETATLKEIDLCSVVICIWVLGVVGVWWLARRCNKTLMLGCGNEMTESSLLASNGTDNTAHALGRRLWLLASLGWGMFLVVVALSFPSG